MKAVPLATVADPAQVDAVRPLLEGRACVVIGAAPLETPATVGEHEYLIAVNGGISSAPRSVDLWVVASKAWDKPGAMATRPMHRQMLDQAKGRAVRYALFLRGPKEATEAYTLAALAALYCTVDAWSVLDKPTKLHLEQMLCGRVNVKEPCSSGILAVAVALYCGAASVRLAGFSLKPGYNYIKNQHPPRWWRDHVQSDRRALTALRARYGNRLSGDLVEAVAA